MNKTYSFITLGCKVNSYESEGMAIILEKNGYTFCQTGQTPDVVVINTCTVTKISDHKSRQMIRRTINNYPDAIVCVVGCYSQMESEVVSAIKGVAIVLGTQNRGKIGEYLHQYTKERKLIVDVDNILTNHTFDNLNVTSYHDNTRAFLKIQDGCNNFCSYCIIPYARGPMRSRERESIIKEAQTLIDKGFQEIVLTGIHTAGYGVDLQNYHFYDLLQEMIERLQGLKRLRISSIEASEIHDNIIQLIQKDDKIVNHLHIPLQSGSAKIVKLMNRKYSLDEYAAIIEKIRKAQPDISITTDVIVGFPGETEEDFQETVAFIKRMNFSQLHVFPYSPRAGTPAAVMKDQIDGIVKKQRVKELIHLSNEQAKSYARQFVGIVLPILFETYDENTLNLQGHAPNYLKVEAKGSKEMINTIKNVKIKVSGFPLNIGEIVQED